MKSSGDCTNAVVSSAQGLRSSRRKRRRQGARGVLATAVVLPRIGTIARCAAGQCRAPPRRGVDAGRALDRQAREDSLSALVRDLIAEHGQPSAKDGAWAKRVLGSRKRAQRSTLARSSRSRAATAE
jgi:hypothetical protein